MSHVQRSQLRYEADRLSSISQDSQGAWEVLNVRDRRGEDVVKQR